MKRLERILPRVLTAILILTLLICPVSAQDPGGEYVPGKRIQGEPKPALETTAVYVPIRDFMDSLGVDYSIEWRERDRRVFVRAPGLYLTVAEGSKYLNANDRCLYLYGECFLLNDRFMVPIQGMAKACGMTVVWDEVLQDVRVEGDYKPILSGDYFYNETELYWLSRIISSESGVEELDGQIAVGNVVLNRVSRKYWPNTVYGVVFDERFGVTQFTPVSNGTIYNDPLAISVVAAKIALEGVNVAGDSLFFVNESIADSSWFHESCTYVTTIGSHSFYTQDIA